MIFTETRIVHAICRNSWRKVWIWSSLCMERVWKFAYMYVKRLIVLFINIYACVSLQTNWKLIFFFNFINKMSVCVLFSRIFSFFLIIHCWYFRHHTLDWSKENAWLHLWLHQASVLTQFFPPNWYVIL